MEGIKICAVFLSILIARYIMFIHASLSPASQLANTFTPMLTH